MPEKEPLFCFRTRDGLIFGPYSTYEIAAYWSRRCRFSVEGVYLLAPLRLDQTL